MNFHSEDTLLTYYKILTTIKSSHSNHIPTRKQKCDFLKVMNNQIKNGASSKTPELIRYIHLLEKTRGFSIIITSEDQFGSRVLLDIHEELLNLMSKGMVCEGNVMFPEFKNLQSKICHFNRILHIDNSSKNNYQHITKLRNYNIRTNKYIIDKRVNRHICDFYLFLYLEVYLLS